MKKHIKDRLEEKFPSRKTNDEKARFRKEIIEELKECGITARVERTSDEKNDNIIIGNPCAAKAVFTAHYDTPASSLFPNIMIPRCVPLFWAYQFLPLIFIISVSVLCGYFIKTLLPLSDDNSRYAFLLGFLVVYYTLYFLMFRVFKNRHNANDNTSGVATVLSIATALTEEERGDVAFILFDNEEKGKKGSKAYFKDHAGDMTERFLINFDCVGNGSNIVFIAKKKAEGSRELSVLKESFSEIEGFKVCFYGARGSEANSDYKSFPAGVGCMACKRTSLGLLYTPRIHTAFDTVSKTENIEYISSETVKFIKAL